MQLTLFLIAAVVAAIFTPLADFIGRRIGAVDVPRGRHQHGRSVTRTGGIAVFAGFFAVSLALFAFAPLNPEHKLPIGGVLLGTAFSFLFGLYDDWKELAAAPQFVGQLLAALIAIATTVWIQEVTLPFFGFQRFPLFITIPLTLLWVVGMMNTVNFLDGLDGLASGVALIASLLFAAHMYRLGQPSIALYAVAFAGACAGFLLFNFYPAKIFLGSAGALVVGYGLATLSILAPARVATALLVMAVPIADTAWQIFNRWRQGRPFYEGDRGHLHFRLADLGVPQWRIVLLYWIFCAAFGALSLWVESRWVKLGAFAVMLLAVGIVLRTLGKRSQVDPAAPPQ